MILKPTPGGMGQQCVKGSSRESSREDSEDEVVELSGIYPLTILAMYFLKNQL